MAFDFVDKTGELTPTTDIARARSVIGKFAVTAITTLPTELALELLTVHRCLGEYLALRNAIAGSASKDPLA